MMRWISAFDRIPEAAEQFPAMPPPENAQPGLLQVGSLRVKDLP
jgi:hypothetical protein